MIMIDDIDFEKYKEYKEYIEHIHNEMLKVCGIPKKLQEEKENYEKKN